MGVRTEVPAPGQVLEWEIVEYLGGWEKTTNGLQFQLVKLRHRYLKNRLARGKCYELRHLTGAEKERVERYLMRHVEVCEQIGEHPNIAHNITAAPVGGLWWVLDRWEDGDTLQVRLQEDAMGDYELRVVMTGIANGLAELHNSKIIRRELSPRSVLLRQRDDRPILTDMELAKLVEGKPTVSPDEWPEDPYRALEVGGDVPVDQRADIYSWGRIFVHAADGKLGARGAEDISKVDIPEAVRNLVMQCVAITRSQRPANMNVLLKVLKRWE
jgi:serine/threonine protein kinase